MHHGDSLEDDYVPDDNFVAVEEDEDDGVLIEDEDAGEEQNGIDPVEDSQASGSGQRPADDSGCTAKKRKRREKEKEKKAKVHYMSFIPGAHEFIALETSTARPSGTD